MALTAKKVLYGLLRLVSPLGDGGVSEEFGKTVSVKWFQ